MNRARCLSALALAAVLVWSAPSRADFLIAPSENDNPAFRAAVAALVGDTVDYFDTRLGTLSVAQLLAYDAVFTWTNFDYADAGLFGDNLAAYVDAGGRVVLGAFTTFTNGNFLAGDIMTAAYSPVTSPGGDNFFSDSPYNGDGGDYWDGPLGTVGSYSATFRDNVVLQGSGILNGTFADGAIAGAHRPDYGVIYLGGLDTVGAASGDAELLLANAFTFEATSTPVVPEPNSIVLLSLGVAGLGAYRRRKAQKQHAV